MPSADNLGDTIRLWWHENRAEKGTFAATSLLFRNLWEFLRDSTAERRRSRYGDMEYDWEKRVNTTMGTVSWRARLMGLFHSPYMPTDPEQFREMMAALPIDFHEFTFIDIGSGKGRTLLLASEYPFRRIIGVELIEELHLATVENIQAWTGGNARPSVDALQCRAIEAVCADAREFDLPHEPLLIYLFNPLPEAALRVFVGRLEKSLAEWPRPVWVVYHNPLLEEVVESSPALEKVAATPQYASYRARPRS